jgi:dipeptidyl aminopeptidase/acylaminoacyl peptidase
VLKKNVSLIVLLLMVLFLSSGLIAGDLPAPLIPVKDFFKNSDKSNYKLSPNGEYLAFLQPWNNRMNVHVQKIGEDKVTRLTAAEKRDIAGFLWGNDTRIVYIQDTGGDENFKAYGVNIDGSNFKELTPFDKVQVQLVDELKNSPDEMLIGLNKRNPQIFDVYRININTGDMTMVAENPGNIQGWVTDREGRVRVATTSDGINGSLLYREKESDPFKTILTTSFKESLSPLFFTFDNQFLYVSSNLDRDKAAIFKYDIANGKFLEKIFEHPDVDVSGLIVSDKQKKLLAVSYTLDKTEYFFFDKEAETMQKYLESKLPDMEVVVVGFSKDETKYLLKTRSDKTRGAYYFYNVTTKELKKLADVSPWLNPEFMADMKPITYKSSDGLTIHGYLTLPKGVAPKNLPLVVNPHGGPWLRDEWGYNPEVQFLANRGYAVLQMNYRGSTGYGKAFWQASFKQWGKKMQDDITDGVKMLIEKGIVDPKRVGIYGGSYGGYATLAGLAFTPDLYACGVDYVGVSSIFSWLKAFPPYWKPLLDMVYEMVGNPETEKELLTSVSPIFHVDKIKAPLFVAQGVNDPRVPKTESDQLVEALKKRGIDVPYMVKDNEGHGFRNEENRFDFYRAMEQFLGKYLGGRVEVEKDIK